MNSQFRNLKNDDIKKYPNNTSVIIGKVNFKTNPNDLIGIYVGSELRGITKIINYNKESWFNLSANCSGGIEKGNLVYYNSITNKNIDNYDLEFSIGQNIGSFDKPINLFEKKSNELKSVTHEIKYENAKLQVFLNSKNTDIIKINVKSNNKLLKELKLNNFLLNQDINIPFDNNLSKNITFEMILKNNNILGDKFIKVSPGQNISTTLNLVKEIENSICTNCMKISTNKNIIICPACKGRLITFDKNKEKINHLIKNKITENNNNLKNTKITIDKLSKDHKNKIKYYYNLNRNYEDRIRDIKSLLKRGLLKNASYENYTKKLDLNNKIISKLNNDHDIIVRDINLKAAEIEKQNKKLMKINLNEYETKYSLLIENNFSKNSKNYISVNTSNPSIKISDDTSDKIKNFNSQGEIDLIYISKYNIENPIIKKSNIPSILYIQPLLNGKVSNLGKYQLDVMVGEEVRGRSGIMTKNIIAIPINSLGIPEQASIKLCFEDNNWINSSAIIPINSSKIIGNANLPLKVNFGNTAAEIISINFSFNNTLNIIEIKNNQIVTIKTLGINNLNQEANLILNDKHYLGIISSNIAIINIPREDIINLVEGTHTVEVSVSNDFGNQAPNLTKSFIVDKSEPEAPIGNDDSEPIVEISQTIIPAIFYAKLTYNNTALDLNKNVEIYVGEEKRQVADLVSKDGDTLILCPIPLKQHSEQVTKIVLVDKVRGVSFPITDIDITIESSKRTDLQLINATFNELINETDNATPAFFIAELTKNGISMVEGDKIRIINSHTSKIIKEDKIVLRNDKSYILSQINISSEVDIEFQFQNNQSEFQSYNQQPITIKPGDVRGTLQNPFQIRINNQIKLLNGETVFIKDKDENIVYCDAMLVDCEFICGGDKKQDCDGTCGGTKILDECLLCVEPGTTYECGCEDIPEGFCDCFGNKLDECGVCGGNGIPQGDCNCDGKVLDECGVCDGDSTTCAGCDGVPNSGKELDECGVCDGDSTTCAGCDGVPNSGKELDECGVCGGDNSSCAGCDGIPYSGKELDQCGVCDGDNNCNLEIELTGYKSENKELEFTIDSGFIKNKVIYVQLYAHIGNSNDPLQNSGNFKDGDMIDDFKFRWMKTSDIVKSEFDDKDNILYFLEREIKHGQNKLSIKLNGLFNDILLQAAIYSAFTGEIMENMVVSKQARLKNLNIAGIVGDPHILTFGGNRCELPHNINKYNLLETPNFSLHGDTVIKNGEALLNDAKFTYNGSSFKINLFSLDITEKNGFESEFLSYKVSKKTIEITTKDGHYVLILNSEINGLIIKSDENISQENCFGVLMSDSFDDCIISEL